MHPDISYMVPTLSSQNHNPYRIPTSPMIVQTAKDTLLRVYDELLEDCSEGIDLCKGSSTGMRVHIHMIVCLWNTVGLRVCSFIYVYFYMGWFGAAPKKISWLRKFPGWYERAIACGPGTLRLRQ